jgi:flagellar biosynthesis protein FlhG
MVICENVKRKIIPIASGKGGVGKTVLAANLALALAKSGKSTVVVDLDLGGSNLHTCLGMKNTHPGIGNFLSDGAMRFSDIVQKTPYDNLRFVAGDVLVSCVADVQFSQRRRLITNILELDADYVLIDLGSGTGSGVLDYFLISNSGFIVTTTQIVSILNAYGFLKNLVFRFLSRALASHKVASSYLKKIVKERRPDSAPSCQEIIEEIQGRDRETGEKIRMYLSVLKPKLIVNMVRSPEELGIVEKLRDTVQKNLMIEIECMGIVFYDPQVEKSFAEYTPLLASGGDALAAKEIERIALRIVQSDRFPELPLDFGYYKDTFELAQIEAQYDFEELKAVPQDREGEEAVGVDGALNNLLAVITEQKKEISGLRNTVRMLTMKGGQTPDGGGFLGGGLLGGNLP